MHSSPMYFTSQLRTLQETTHSLRAEQYIKKRKTQSDDDDDTDINTNTDEQQQPPSISHLQDCFASQEIAQLRVAGLLPAEEHEVPPAPFPHAPVPLPKDQNGTASIQEQMAGSPSRLYAVNATSKGGLNPDREPSNSLKQKHLNILSTLLHRCLLEGDYERASRAWGMILRTQVTGGYPVDPRNHGRWGIGAEILLRRKISSLTPQDHPPQSDGSTPEDAIFSDEGYELAKSYFERLIVQHPYRRAQPHAIDERAFYPALFSLLIYESSEKSGRARRRMRDDAERDSRSSRSSSIDRSRDKTTKDSLAQEEAILQEELNQATAIAQRLDLLISSPPFDKQVELLQLRGSISLWISDLIEGRTALNEDEDEDEDWDMDTSIRSSEDDPESITTKATRVRECSRELKEALKFFQRAETNGASREAVQIRSIDIRLKELAREEEKLRASQANGYSAFSRF